MIFITVKILVWLTVVKVHTVVDRWSVWLGLFVAGLFVFFDSLGQQWDLLLLGMFAVYWCIASATLAAFGRCESVLGRLLIIGAGSFVLISGPWFMPVPL